MDISRLLFLFCLAFSKISEKQLCDVGTRSDCTPNTPVTEEKCTSLGCCWAESSEENEPWCFYPYSERPGYSSVTVDDETLEGEAVRQGLVLWPRPVTKISWSIKKCGNEAMFRLKIWDSLQTRYEMPGAITCDEFVSSSSVEFNIIKDPLIFNIRDKGAPLLDTSAGPLIFSDQFLEISIAVDGSSEIFGIGERRGSLAVKRNLWSHGIWNRDMAPNEDLNLYGDQPIWIVFDKSRNIYFGYVFWNSNAKSVTVGEEKVTLRSSGGIIDLFFVTGKSAENIVSKIHQIMGGTMIPPMWSLGYHLCRWGYNSSDETLRINREMRQASIPQEVQWNDIDYMFKKRDFTFDPDSFKTLPLVIDEIHDEGQKYIVILDPAIPTDIDPAESYSPLTDGIADDVFIKDDEGNFASGVVWPGGTYFPDFSASKTTEYWSKQIEKLFNLGIEFDGIWIDMNEPSNFVDGSKDGCIENRFNNPPWVPPIVGNYLPSKTLCPSYQQELSSHYNVHNMYGFHETVATHSALLELKHDKRPFILTRSTAMGSGKYAAHWTGDNYSRWEDLRFSISAMVTLNIFGMKMAGVDVCGFQEPTTEELCVRWHQAGAFLYSFFRNHNTINEKSQHPTAFSVAAQNIIRKAIETRYELLPHLYTVLLSEVMFVRPIVFDEHVGQEYSSVSEQFMVGQDILVCPVLSPEQKEVECIIPKGIWCSVFQLSYCLSAEQTESRTFGVKMEEIPAFYRGGRTFLLQNAEMTIEKALRNPLQAVVIFDTNGVSKGRLLVDDGESVSSDSVMFFFDTKRNETAAQMEISCKISSRVPDTDYLSSFRNLILSKIYIPNEASSFVKSLTVNSKHVAIDKKLRFNSVLTFEFELDLMTENCLKPLTIYWDF